MWCSVMEMSNARRVGRHSRHSRSISSSLLKKKGKNHGSNHHNSNGSKSKQKAQPPLPPPAAAPPVHAIPPESTVFDVLDFGAKGDGSTDDTKVKV